VLNRGRVRYLRVSLLDSCNLNCFYCRPDSQSTHKEVGSQPPEMFERSIELLHQLGVRKVRFTGGEPTLYKQLPRLIAFTRSLGDSHHIALTSNGLLLHQHARELAAAGLDSINISLDTSERERFKRITGKDAFQQVISGIDAALKYIGTVKLNCVLMRGVNDEDAANMVAFADQRGVDIRFIEFMPSRSEPNRDRRYIAGDEIRARLPYELKPVYSDPAAAARYYESPRLNIRVGFINPVSHPFCRDCDRLRLASDGNLYGCLFSGQSTNLFDLLENDPGSSGEAIATLVRSKKYLGCAQAEQLPSFIRMGG